MALNFFQVSGTADKIMKQILIQSERDDYSTDDVLSWLYYLDRNLIVNTLFDSYPINSLSLEMSNKNKLSITVNALNLDRQNCFWYRRGQLTTPFKDTGNYSNIQSKVHKETMQPIREFLESNCTTNTINRFKDNFVNKLDMLYLALSLNIKIPNTLITEKSTELFEFVSNNITVITKPIKNPFINFIHGNFTVKFSTHSKLITIEDIPKNTSYFMPSFFQKYIDKKYEIRSFYLDGVFKSMAIFSQENEKTKIDFRNYDYIRPNRCIPYKLPDNLEKKLHKLMKKLNLNCGSFDIICTPKNEYYFLEVNPIGQFQWLSRHCNYYIERLIAKKILIDG